MYSRPVAGRGTIAVRSGRRRPVENRRRASRRLGTLARMTDPVRVIADSVRTRARRGTLAGTAEDAVREELQRYAEHAFGADVPLIADEGRAAREAVADLTGFGQLQPLLDDPSIEEVWINAPTRVFVARGGVPELTPIVLGEQEVRDLVERMLVASGRRVDLASPFVDASLPDGSRLHVVIPDVTRRHWAVNIRKFSDRITTLDALVGLGSMPAAAAEFLAAAMLAGLNVLVSGATQAGKVASPQATRNAVGCRLESALVLASRTAVVSPILKTGEST